MADLTAGGVEAHASSFTAGAGEEEDSHGGGEHDGDQDKKKREGAAVAGSFHVLVGGVGPFGPLEFDGGAEDTVTDAGIRQLTAICGEILLELAGIGEETCGNGKF